MSETRKVGDAQGVVSGGREAERGLVWGEILMSCEWSFFGLAWGI